MVLSNYDPKILNFLYELTKLDKPMSYREISDRVQLETGKISPKTVERWFNFLKQPYNHPKSKTKDKFDYFPKFYYEKLGLITLYVISSNPSQKVLDSSRLNIYQNYAAWLYDFEIKKSVLLTGYLVPISSIGDFRAYWKKLKKDNFIESYDIFVIHSGKMIYSPWHKVLSNRGIFDPDNNLNYEVKYQVDSLKKFYDSVPKLDMIGEVKRNPLIIPTLFESWWETKSSYKIWESIRKKMGNRSWEYIKKTKSKTEGVGVKKVQETLMQIKRLNLSYEMKLIYMPLQLDNIFVYAFLNFKNKQELFKKIYEIARSSVQLTFYPISGKGCEVLVISLTNHKGLARFLENIEKTSVRKILILQHEKSLSLLTTKKYTRFNYDSLFDTKKLNWI